MIANGRRYRKRVRRHENACRVMAEDKGKILVAVAPLLLGLLDPSVV